MKLDKCNVEQAKTFENFSIWHSYHQTDISQRWTESLARASNKLLIKL